MIPEDYQGEGEWICGTDLMQMESGNPRPRLLPDGVKMMVFIEKEEEPRKAPACPAWSNTYLACDKVQTERNRLYNMKFYEKPTQPKQFSAIHPKKRFLKRFLQDQDCC